MFNLDKIAQSLQSNPDMRNTAAGGLAGLAAGMLLSGGKPGKLAGNAVKLGAVAAIGGLAYSAWQNYQKSNAGQRAGARPADEAAFIPASGDAVAQEELGRSLVRAMIAAAKADGQVDAAEKAAIFDKLEPMNLGPEEKAWVFDELASPLNINAVVAPATTPEIASEIYAASLVAMTADTPAERAYLDALASKLRLDPALVRAIHAEADAQSDG